MCVMRVCLCVVTLIAFWFARHNLQYKFVLRRPAEEMERVFPTHLSLSLSLSARAEIFLRQRAHTHTST